MPRTKRALVEADPNAEVSTAKKTSKGKKAASAGKAMANKAASATSATSAASAASDANNENNASGSTAERSAVEPATSKNAVCPPVISAAELPNFLVINRPFWDLEAERYDKSVEEADDDDDEDEEQKEDIFELPDEDRPEWPWVITKDGMSKYQWLTRQASYRDQDEHDSYIFNDFTAYGVQEIVDNWLNDFHKEVSRRTVSPFAVWVQLEGFALFSQLDYINIWFQGDDRHGFAETIGIIGKALLTGLHLLKDRQLLKPYEHGGLRNIPTIMALYVQFVGTWVNIGGDHYGETKWVARLAKLAKENNIDIKGPYKFPADKRTQELLEPDPANEKQKKFRLSEGTWGIPYYIDADVEDEWDIKDDGDYSVKGWKRAFKTYTGGVRIGGTHYFLTKATKHRYRLGA